jgi:Zn-dependent M28 family amino/carboxypeptidase
MRIKKLFIAIAVVLLTTVSASAQRINVNAQQKGHEPSVDRLKKDVSYLASDQLEGRRTGTTGANEAAKYIAAQFSKIGLKPGEARYLQSFPYVAGVELGKNNRLLSLKAGKDWMPLGFSANQSMEGVPAILVGYGITASELSHNDYSSPKVAGRIAIALSGRPDGDNPHGQFARHEGVRWKAIAARNAGAKALIVIASENNFNQDPLSRLRYDNTAGDAGIPVIAISRQAAETLLNKPIPEIEQAAKSKSDLAYVELTNLINLSVDLIRKAVPAYNVIGVLEGSDPVLKNENIVIGAHYDHLGRGGEGSGSLAPNSAEIHHGADDNASGTAGLIELARIFMAQKPRPKRTLIFIAFGGEEEGLLGSAHYVNHPLTPLSNTVAMINMDMIGRMRDRKLVIGGVGTAAEWKQIIQQANITLSMQGSVNSSDPANGVRIVISTDGNPISTVEPYGAFELTMNEDGYGPSDHSQFYGKQIPVLFFWTGTHRDYHKPSDTFEKINYDDEARILRLVENIVRDVDDAGKRLTFQTAKADPPRGGGFRVYLGTIPNYADSTNGLLIDGVREGSPAEKGGIKAGDRIVKIGTREVKNVYDYTAALGEMKAGQEYVFEVVRGAEKLTLKVTPEARK